MSRRRRAPAERGGERSSAYWDGVASAAGGAVPALWRLHADRATSALLNRWLPPRCGRVLKTDLYDESCTDGLVPALAGRADVVVGIDVSTVVARRAATDGVVLAVACDVRRLPFRPGTFDAVVSNSTLDHFAERSDIGRALRELERVLSDDGSLVLTLDNPGHPLLRLRAALAPLWRRLGLVPYPLGATYGSRALHEALVASGFEVVEMTAVHHFPRIALVAVQRLLRGALAANVLRVAHGAERFAAWRSRFLTGQYVAALARPARRAATSEAAA